MAKQTYIRLVAKWYLICINLCAVIVLELVFFGAPYISLFLVILFICFRLNTRLAKYWVSKGSKPLLPSLGAS